MERELEKAISTGEVARLCNATTASVNNWIKNNKITAYNTPGGQYRILIKDLLKFIRENNMPVPYELKKFFGKKVLIIDDDPETVDMLTEVAMMVREDLEILVANDGYDGLLKAGESKPDLIFLDINLPKLDGFEVCEKIKSNPSNQGSNIFIISAYVGNKEFTEKLDNCLADKIFTKPVEIAELKNDVETVLLS
jgi:two-component system, OmpR family, response regulator